VSVVVGRCKNKSLVLLLLTVWSSSLTISFFFASWICRWRWRRSRTKWHRSGIDNDSDEGDHVDEGQDRINMVVMPAVVRLQTCLHACFASRRSLTWRPMAQRHPSVSNSQGYRRMAINSLNHVLCSKLFLDPDRIGFETDGNGLPAPKAFRSLLKEFANSERMTNALPFQWNIRSWSKSKSAVNTTSTLPFPFRSWGRPVHRLFGQTLGDTDIGTTRNLAKVAIISFKSDIHIELDRYQVPIPYMIIVNM
jgi:hypothetical protein